MGVCAQCAGPAKYVICNADESEPGTFKDRLVLEGDPHAIVEAMAMPAMPWARTKATFTFAANTDMAQQRVQNAIEQARKPGLLGQNIFGTDFNFDIHVHPGAGAYICGEETALIESIEGKRGEPRSRPPYPPTHGLWGKPTLVNNVETLANVPAILRNGAEWYRIVRHAKERRHQGLHDPGQRQRDRADRSADGHHAARGDRISTAKA